MSKSRMTRRAAIKHYSLIKRSAFHETRKQFRSILGDSFSITELNDSCFDEIASWNTGLNWSRLLRQSNTFKPRHLGVAIFSVENDGVENNGQNAQLCGAAFGRASRGHNKTSHVRIDYLARAPDPNPLAGYITNIVLACALRYAELTDKYRVLFTSPSKDPAIFNHFSRLFHGKYCPSDPNFPYDYFYMDLNG